MCGDLNQHKADASLCLSNCLFIDNANCDCKQHLWGAFKVLKGTQCTLQKHFFYMQLVCSWHIILIYSLKSVPGLAGSVLWVYRLREAQNWLEPKGHPPHSPSGGLSLSNIRAWSCPLRGLSWLPWQPLERSWTLGSLGPASNPASSFASNWRLSFLRTVCKGG